MATDSSHQTDNPIVQRIMAQARQTRQAVSPWVQRWLADAGPDKTNQPHPVAFTTANNGAIVNRVQRMADRARVWQPSVGSLNPALPDRFSQTIVDQFPPLANKFKAETLSAQVASGAELTLAETAPTGGFRIDEPAEIVEETPLPPRPAPPPLPRSVLPDIQRVMSPPSPPKPTPVQRTVTGRSPQALSPRARPVSRIEELTPGKSPSTPIEPPSMSPSAPVQPTLVEPTSAPEPEDIITAPPGSYQAEPVQPPVSARLAETPSAPHPEPILSRQAEPPTPATEPNLSASEPDRPAEVSAAVSASVQPTIQAPPHLEQPIQQRAEAKANLPLTTSLTPIPAKVTPASTQSATPAPVQRQEESGPDFSDEEEEPPVQRQISAQSDQAVDLPLQPKSGSTLPELSEPESSSPTVQRRIEPPRPTEPASIQRQEEVSPPLGPSVPSVLSDSEAKFSQPIAPLQPQVQSSPSDISTSDIPVSDLSLAQPSIADTPAVLSLPELSGLLDSESTPTQADIVPPVQYQAEPIQPPLSARLAETPPAPHSEPILSHQAEPPTPAAESRPSPSEPDRPAEVSAAVSAPVQPTIQASPHLEQTIQRRAEAKANLPLTTPLAPIPVKVTPSVLPSASTEVPAQPFHLDNPIGQRQADIGLDKPVAAPRIEPLVSRPAPPIQPLLVSRVQRSGMTFLQRQPMAQPVEAAPVGLADEPTVLPRTSAVPAFSLPLAAVQRQVSTRAIQREEADSSPLAAVGEAASAVSGAIGAAASAISGAVSGGEQKPDLDRLARQILPQIKRLLSIEQERQAKNTRF